MDRYQGSRSRSDGFLYLRHIHQARVRIYVNKDWAIACQCDCLGRGDEGVRDRDNLASTIALAKYLNERQVKRISTIAAQRPMAPATEVRKLFSKRLMVRAADKAAGCQATADGRSAAEESGSRALGNHVRLISMTGCSFAHQHSSRIH